MKPEVTRVLEHTAANLMREIAPALMPAYRQSTVTALGALLLCAREEFDRAAARRAEENTALRALFSRAHRAVGDAELADRLRTAADETNTDLRVPVLEASNQALRELLIALHTHVESAEDEQARAIEADIWTELAASTERRRLALSVF